nr:reverse transcriptase domain-containing protein [Tanacetum cinerariifolium]
MTDNRTMAEMLRVPTEGCAEAIVVPPILTEQFELKHSLINMMTSDQFFGLEKDNSHDHVRATRRWLEKEPPRSITTWDDLVSKFINEFFPPSRTTNLRNEISNFQQKFDESFHEAWERSRFLECCCRWQLSELAKLTHTVNQQTSAVTTAMTAMLKQFQSNPPPAQVKDVEETYVTYRCAHPYYQCLVAGGNTFPEYRDNIQGYVSAATGNYNQGNPGYRPQGVANHMRPPGFAQPNMNIASTSMSGTLPGNTIAKPKGELKAITTRSGLATDGPTVPNPPKSVNPEEDECVEETYTDPDLTEYTIKVPP